MSVEGMRFIVREPGVQIEGLDVQIARIEAKLDAILALLQRKGPGRPRKATRSEFSKEFELLWALYPKRSGSNSKRKAFMALQARQYDGETVSSMMAGLQRYGAYCKATGITGTNYVMQASRFFGRDREWENEWTIPVSTAQPKTDDEWLVLAQQRQVTAKPGESWDSFKARIMEAK